MSFEQFLFRKGRGTRNAIFATRCSTKRSIQHQQDVFRAFIDYEKAFDKVKHEDMMKDLQEFGVDGIDIRIFKNLYWDQIAAISVDGELSIWTQIKRGVRQGCVISPDLFSLGAELILRRVK